MPSTVLHALTMNIVAKNASPTILRISVSPDSKGTDALCDQKARHDENRSIMPTELSVARSMRSEEHTSELQSLMRISYAVFCLKKKTPSYQNIHSNTHRKYDISAYCSGISDNKQ